MSPLTTILLYSTLAAVGAALAGIGFLGRRQVAPRWLGWSNALAAGLMFGAAYSLLIASLPATPWPPVLGALLGVGWVNLTHRLTGTSDLELNRLQEVGREYSRKVFLVQSLHSAWEGVAVGAAASIDLGLGLFLLGILALHNVAEGVVLVAVLRARGMRTGRASSLAVLSNGPQIVLAGATLLLLESAPAVGPWVAGFAVGALVHLVLVELLPEAYKEAGTTSIALLTSAAIGVAILLLEVVS